MLFKKNSKSHKITNWASFLRTSENYAALLSKKKKKIKQFLHALERKLFSPKLKNSEYKKSQILSTKFQNLLNLRGFY